MALYRDCEEGLGLEDAEWATLTGFTGRAAKALAHLREAWLVADDNNCAAIESALRQLFALSHSFARNRALFERVLTSGMDERQSATLLRALGVEGEP